MDDGHGDPYLRNAEVAIRAIRLLCPGEDFDEDNLEFGVSFAWPNVPSPVKLVRSFMEQRAAGASVAAAIAAAAPAVPEAFVYGVIYGELYVVPRSVAEKWASLFRGLNGSQTWGELKQKVSPALYEETLEVLGRRRMSADASIDHEALAEESFPPHLGGLMKCHLPSELEHLVRIQESAIGEELPWLSRDALPEVLAFFASLGVPCTEDQALVVEAAGYETDRPEEMRG
jgi:hypothetical protein